MLYNTLAANLKRQPEMIIIKAIEIYNFRSIIKFDSKITPKDLNIIVGQNDIGKSNFLKALNLFFNNETEIKNSYRFQDDFSKHAKVPNKKAPEIKIVVEFETPKRFKDKNTLVWTKTWRANGLFKDELLTSSGAEPTGRSGAAQWVRKVKYKYVPAVRGTEYFNILMGDLHDALSEINPKTFSTASNQFIDGLKNQVGLLVKSISTELGYSSKIGMPTDFKQLFSTLDFSLDKGGAMISLNKRGDGIKAQHIPIILKFIASHYKSVSGQAIINPDTIWGFEEPENNMEMGNAFKLAKIFANFSTDLQIFINTHSPAFYSLGKDFSKQTSLFLVKNTEGNLGTKINPVELSDFQVFDQEMGLLPIVTDYIKNEVELRQKAEEKATELSKLKSNTKYLVLSEDTDLSYVKKLFEMQGFPNDKTEYVSYDSRSNLLAAMQSCKIELVNKPDLTDIIFHRDSDIYDNDELDKDRINERLVKLNESKKVKYHLFKTDGYDVESYFINAEHICKLYKSFDNETVKKFIKEATDETKQKSMDKLYGKLETYRKEYESRGETYKFSSSKYIKKLQELYDNNTERYRYGKTVLGILTSKLSKGNGTIDLVQGTDKIDIPMLKKILK